MPHWKKHFNYKYTGAYEMLPGEEKTLTLLRLADELVKNEKGEENLCFVGYFKEVEKPLIINKVNSKAIGKLYGPLDENWIDKQITFFVKTERTFGEMVDVIRVRPVIPSVAKSDYAPQFAQLRACKDLPELQKVYTAFTSAQKAGTLTIKEEMKTKLSNAQ